MLPKFLANTFTYLQKRMQTASAIEMWNEGHPSNNSFKEREKWPVKIWTELLRKETIHIHPVDIRTKHLAMIKDVEFWTVVSQIVPHDDVLWDSWAPIAFESGNVACINALPKHIQLINLECVGSHPACKTWLLAHPAYGRDATASKSWGALYYGPFFQKYLNGNIGSDELLTIVKDNLVFEGKATAIQAFLSCVKMVHGYTNSIPYNERVSIPIHQTPEVDTLMREIWKLTESAIPFEIICSAYYLKPDLKKTTPDLFQDSLAIMQYGLAHNFWPSAWSYKRDTSVSVIETCLDLVQPSTQDEMIGVLARHYNALIKPHESVEWKSSFGEPSEGAL